MFGISFVVLKGMVAKQQKFDEGVASLFRQHGFFIWPPPPHFRTLPAGVSLWVFISLFELWVFPGIPYVFKKVPC